MAPLSFAAVAEKKVEDAKPLSAVQLSGHVVLKIAKHCKECMPSLVTGQLLGLDVGSTLEVTDCFPFPVSSWLCAVHTVPVEKSVSYGLLWCAEPIGGGRGERCGWR